MDLIRRLCLSSPEFKEFYDAVIGGKVETIVNQYIEQNVYNVINNYIEEHLETIVKNYLAENLYQIVRQIVIELGVSELPHVTEADNGMLLQVVDGEWNKSDIGNIEDGEY